MLLYSYGQYNSIFESTLHDLEWATNSFVASAYVGIAIAFIIDGIFWGCISRAICKGKGYDGGFALGFWLAIIGVIIAACKPDNRYSYVSDSDARYSSSTSYKPRTISYEKSYQEPPRALNAGEWRCLKCGTINQSYTGTCRCGMTKAGVDTRERPQLETTAKTESVQPATVAPTADTGDNELSIVKSIKAYKELYDTGVITEEEFTKKKRELLGLK